ncbi:hypothetical protein OIU74_016962 [Salix koriyanagi]|uniref:Uncharacterized protein n=1 Tax=Salix koriyanagi TaxID=2511006 RepID=A0A9Q0PIB9_9ROSI|nr:hypothetical protein OIU74_016962 [Salix koriyanagi]
MVHVGFISQSRKPVKKQFDACRFHMLAALISELEPMPDRAHDIPRMDNPHPRSINPKRVITPCLWGARVGLRSY